jgi:hypothetical protein
MGTVVLKYVAEFCDYSGCPTVFLPTDAGKDTVSFLDSNPVRFCQCDRLFDAIPAGCRGMHQEAADTLRAVQQTLHGRKDSRGIGIVQFIAVGFKRRQFLITSALV